MHFFGKRVLVTGGAGFIGSNLVDRLVEMKASVTVLDDLFTGDLNHIQYRDQIQFVEGSVTDYKLVEELVGDSELVFHLAARNMIVSTKTPYLDFEVNARGTFNVLLACRRRGVKRLVYASSVSVYGNPRYLPINENDGYNILNPYAASKMTGENYCQAFYETYGVPVTIVRYSNVYGVKQSPANPYCGVVAKFFHQVMRGEAPHIHGDGEQTRDFTYVDDVVEATILAALSPRAEGETFNVSTGIEISVNELAREILRVCGRDLEPVYVDRRDIDNIRRRVMNIEKIRKVLRWIPTVTLREGLRRTYQWLQTAHQPSGQMEG
ncbi:MAG: NAD-dependent epimerase/dehydratase family protein [Calditrichaeota bacterium]|nr:MAG: NAD-dependent epimerase/dehydratase family protein [Calditrichota bacterium]